MKNQIRKLNKAKRAAMDKSEAAEKSRAAAKAFLQSEIYKNSKQIMLYMPLGNETDTTDIMNAALNDGKAVVLPVTDEKSGVITPFAVGADTAFKKGAFSVVEPVGAELADMEKTDVILVPGIAFDKHGSRVGFGKGCYDRFLKSTSAVKVGFCYDFQLCDGIPADGHDIKMDLLITENGIIRI